MISIVFASLWSWALTVQVNAPCLVQNANFRPSRTGLAELALPVQILAAVPKIELLDNEGKIIEQCSATSVSSHGHLLSAAHCFQRCMERAGLYKKEGGISRVDRAKLSETVCKVNVDGKPSEARLLAVSDCRNEERTPDSGCPRQDYVLLQLKSSAPAGCFALAGSTPGPGVDVASVGHPIRTWRAQWRSDAKDSNGKEQFVSEGKTIPATGYCYKMVDQGSDERAGRRYFESKSAEDPLNGVRSGDYIQTKGSDQYKRSSGGPLVAMPSGTVVGISGFALGHTNQGQFTECEGATFYVAVAPIVSAIKRDFPSVDLGLVLDCDKPIGGSK